MYIYHKDGQIKLVSDKPVGIEGLTEVSVCVGFRSPKNIIRNYYIRNGKLVPKYKRIYKKRLRIAMVGVWGTPCGIATYTEFLVKELRTAGHEVTVFAEHAEDAVQEDYVVRCWERGKSLSKLVRKLKQYDPDVLFVQHEYGIFPDARKWTSFLSQIQHFNHHVVLHSVYKHQDKTVCESICKNIIVHSAAAKQILLDKGITSNIRVIPHGCRVLEETSRLWNIYRTPHTLMQFGFGFEYKGWEVALDAVRHLKQKYPDVFYLILFSESPFVQDLHESEYQKIVELVQEKDLEENVSIIRGFQSDESLDNFLRTIRVAIFPYTADPEHTVFGSSGAARLALANGTPTIVSQVPLFYDLEGTVPRISNSQELAAEIDKLFSDWKIYKKQSEKQLEFVRAHSWEKTAQRYIDAI